MPRIISKCKAGGIDPGEFATAICDALAPKLQAIVDAVNAIQINFDGDVTVTPYCVPETGEALFLCKVTDVETGDISWSFHIADGNTLVPYDGPYEKCEDETCFLTAACFEGCYSGVLQIDKATMLPVGYAYVGAEGVAVNSTEPPPAALYSYGACNLRRQKITVWVPKADGSGHCPIGKFTVDLDADGKPKRWWLADGLMEVLIDPTAGLDEFTLLPCGDTLAAEAATTQTVVCTIDVNAIDGIDNNATAGPAVTVPDVCSLDVEPVWKAECPPGADPVTVTFTSCTGDTIVETLAGPRSYQCLGSDVTITGCAMVYATGPQEIPIEECP